MRTAAWDRIGNREHESNRMQPSQIFQALRRRWYATAAVVVAAVVIGAVCATTLGSAPQGTATVQILVDSPVSALVNLQANQTGLESRASVLAQAMSSNAVVGAIAKSAGVPANEVTAQGPYSGAGEVLNVPTPSEARGMQVGSAAARYRMTIQAQQDLPIVTVGVQGPTPAQAGALASHVLAGTNAWLATLTTASQLKAGKVVHLRQLGDAQAGSLHTSSGKIVGAIGAVAVLMLGLLAIVLTDPARRERRRRERERAEELLRLALEREDPAETRLIIPAGAGSSENGHHAAENGDERARPVEKLDTADAEDWLESLADDPTHPRERDRDSRPTPPGKVSAAGSQQRQA